MVGRCLQALAAAVVLAGSGGAAFAASDGGRPFTIDDLLGMEAIGAVRISPDARWIVVEREAAYDTASRYDIDYYSRVAITDLEIHDASGALSRVIGRDDPFGYQAGPFSPDGKRMVVYRLSDDRRWRIGVVTLATGAALWLDVTPENSQVGRSVAWRTDDELVFVARADGDLPIVLRIGSQTQARTSRLWDEAIEGRSPTATLVVSGAGRDQRPQAAPKRLMSLTLSSGALKTWASGEIIDFELSPDGRKCALLVNGEDIQSPPPGPAKIGTPNRRRRLQIVDLATGALQDPLPERDLLSHLLAWSPDSRRLLVFDRPLGGTWPEGSLTQIDRDSGRAHPLPMTDAAPVILETGERIPIVRAGWVGRTPMVWGEAAEGEPGWRALLPDGSTRDLGVPADPAGRWANTARGTFYNGASGLWSVSPAGSQAVGSGRFQYRQTEHDMGGRSASNPDAVEVGASAVIGADGCLRTEPLTAPTFCPPPLGGSEKIVAASPRADFVVTRQLGADGVLRLRLHSADGASQDMATANAALAEVQWGPVVEVDHQGFDGRPLKSWILTPAGSRPASGWPTIVVAYPGKTFPDPPARLASGSDLTQFNPAVMASSGYAVMMVSLPGHDAPGPGLGNVGDEIWKIVEAGTGDGLIDPARVALFGHSYGGHTALLVATQTDRFRTIIASAGFADYGAANRATRHFAVVPEDGYILGGAGWLEAGQARMGGPSWADPEAYVANSPVYRADRIRTPVLIVHGDLDPVSAETMFANLYQLGREAGLLTFWGEGHVLMSPANIRELHERLLAWLDRYMAASGEPSLPVADPDL